MDGKQPRPHNSDSDSDWDTTEDFNSPRHDSQAQSWKQHLPPPVSQTTPRTPTRGAGNRPPEDRSAYQDGGAGGQEGMPQGRAEGNTAPSPRPRGFKLPALDGPASDSNWDAREDRSSRQVSRADGGDWGDSENEERTLRELRETMRREKSKEREKERQQAELKARLAQQVASRGGSAYQEPDSVRDIYAVPSKGPRYEKQATPTPTPLPPPREEILTPGLVYLSSPQDTTQNALLHQEELVYHDTDNNRCRYFFQKNNPSYYEVEEPEQEAVTPKIADKVEKVLRRGWREVFGVLRIVTGFFVVFAVELTHFATRYIAQPLFLGVVMVIGDRLVKPLLATLYNFLLQPALLLAYNLLLTGQQAVSPALGVSRELALQAAAVLGALRLVAVNSPSPHHGSPPRGNTPRPLPLTNRAMEVV